MANYFENKEKLQQELQPYYREKTNLRLKYAALISISLSIILLLAMAFGVIDKSHPSLVLLMRGCAGLFALLFVILVGILVYRVNTAYFRDKANSPVTNHPSEIPPLNSPDSAPAQLRPSKSPQSTGGAISVQPAPQAVGSKCISLHGAP